jgi:hypothetical protein
LEKFSAVEAEFSMTMAETVFWDLKFVEVTEGKGAKLLFY